MLNKSLLIFFISMLFANSSFAELPLSSYTVYLATAPEWCGACQALESSGFYTTVKEESINYYTIHADGHKELVGYSTILLNDQDAGRATLRSMGLDEPRGVPMFILTRKLADGKVKAISPWFSKHELAEVLSAIIRTKYAEDADVSDDKLSIFFPMMIYQMALDDYFKDAKQE